MTLSDHRRAPQDSPEPDFELELPTQARREHSTEAEDDESHLVRGYD